jgi:hypothetical protein
VSTARVKINTAQAELVARLEVLVGAGA